MYTVMCFAIYGLIFWLLATIGGKARFRIFAYVAVLFAVIEVWLANPIVFYACAAVCSLAVAAVPGLIMLHANVQAES